MFVALLCTLVPIALMVIGGYFATRAARPEVQARKAAELSERVALSEVRSASESRRWRTDVWRTPAERAAQVHAQLARMDAQPRWTAADMTAIGCDPYGADASEGACEGSHTWEQAWSDYGDQPSPPATIYAL